MRAALVRFLGGAIGPGTVAPEVAAHELMVDDTQAASLVKLIEAAALGYLGAL